MSQRSGNRSILVASALCAGALIAGRAFADQASPPPQSLPKQGEPVTIVTDRMVLVDKDGKPVERGPAVINGRRVVIIDHDGEAEGRRMVGPDGRRREMLIMRDGRMDGPGRRGAERMMRMSRELGLTPEQRTQVRALMEASRPKMEELRGQIRAQRLKLREADPEARGYDALAASTSKRIGELTVQREQQRAQLQRQVWQLLTPEQRAKAETRKAEGKKRRGEQADRMERRARELRGTP
jgi:protein CpxP